MKFTVTVLSALTAVALAANDTAPAPSSPAAATPQEIEEFCSSRPTGLYCSPWSVHQKVECPTGDIVTCPKAPTEYCQERGILKQYGFKGGIARCVPYLDPAAVASFCEEAGAPGTFCYGDSDNNIRVQCPSGLIYKCDDNPTNDTKKCDQTRPNFATCQSGGDGGIVDICSSLLPEPVTVTSTVSVSASSSPAMTVTVTRTVTPSPVFSTFVENTTTTVCDSPATITKTLTLSTTSSSGGGIVDVTVSSFEPTSTVSTTSSSAQATPTNGPVCNGSQQKTISTPPGLNVTYQLTSTRATEPAASDMCKTMGGTLLKLGSSLEHWRVGLLICEPVWYKTWETNSYSDPNACIALYPGGATAVPVGGCNEPLLAICQIPTA